MGGVIAMHKWRSCLTGSGFDEAINIKQATRERGKRGRTVSPKTRG